MKLQDTPAREAVSLPANASTERSEGSGIEDVLGSASFQKAPILQRLLRYLWEHRDEEISEYAIGTEALDRPADFDPSSEAQVRVKIARLRRKLEQFYREDGASCRLRIEIPLGGHSLKVRWTEPETVPDAPPGRGRSGGRGLALAAGALTCVALLLAGAWFLRRTAAAPYPALPRFWAAFLSPDKPARMVLLAPLFVTWNKTGLVARDMSANRIADLDQSKELQPIAQRLGQPVVFEKFTDATDSMASGALANFLGRHGYPVGVETTATLPVDDGQDRNLIILGAPKPDSRWGDVLGKLNFHTTAPKRGVVFNRVPRPGEPASFPARFPSPRRMILPGVISLLPQRSGGGGKLLYLGGPSLALVNATTLPYGLEVMDRAWKAAGSPPYFEAVVEAEMESLTLLNLQILAVRPILAN